MTILHSFPTLNQLAKPTSIETPTQEGKQNANFQREKMHRRSFLADCAAPATTL